MSGHTEIDLVIDLNSMDESGLPWAFIDNATDRTLLVPGRHIVAGLGAITAVVVVNDVTDDIVHVRPLHGSVATNRHLLTAKRSA